MKILLKGMLAVTLLGQTTMANADPQAVHGMLLFGDKVTYASHLPMFHSPHDYQLIMKLTMQDMPRSQTLSNYELVKANGSTLFTLVPEVMDLTQLIDGTKTTFNATIFVGHFERGGKSLGPVKVNVENIVFSDKLNGDQQPNHFASYLLFGEQGEYFGAHIIKSKPSFDAIMNVTQPVKLINPGCGRGGCPDPIPMPIADTELPLAVSSSLLTTPENGDLLGSPFDIHSTVKNVIYLEEGELEH